MPQFGVPRLLSPICVHYCGPTVAGRRNSVHTCPNSAPRGPRDQSVYTIASCGHHGSAIVYTNAPIRLRDALATNLCTLLRPHGCWPPQQCTQMAQTGSERPSQPICVHSCGPRSHIMYGFLPEQAPHGCSLRCGTGQLVSLEDCLAGGEEITRMKGLCVWGCPGIAQVLFLYRWKFLLWSRALDSPRFCVWGEASWRQGCVNS